MPNQVYPSCLKEHKCPTCGHIIRPRKEILTKGLVNTLIKFAEAVKKQGRNDIHLQTEMDLTKNEYNNFQKLRYHGLVHHVKDGAGQIKSGCWLLTRRGGSFLRGEFEADKVVYVVDNKIVEYGDETVKISDFFRQEDGFTDEYWQKKFDINISQDKLI